MLPILQEAFVCHLTTERKDSDFVMNKLLGNMVDTVYDINGEKVTILTGYKNLDYLLGGGFQSGYLYVIAGRPSVGKTTFAMNIIQNVAVKRKNCIVLFSLGESREQVATCLLSLQSCVDVKQLRTGKLSETEWEKLINGATEIGESKSIIDDTPSISVDELQKKCRRYKLEQGLTAIFIDYFQLLSGSPENFESHQQELSYISMELKALARELNVPIVLLSQLVRTDEKCEDNRPVLSDLNQSGAIVQDADVVMFLYRGDYDNKDCERNNSIEVIIAKQRNGPIGTVEIVCKGGGV